MRRSEIKYHFLFWIFIYALWVFAFHKYSISITKTLTVEFCYLLFITADYYIISYFTIPKFLQNKRYGLFLISTFLITAFSAWLRALVAVQMNRHFFNPSSVLDFKDLYLNSFLYILFWVLLITTGKMLIDKKRQQQELEFLENEKTKNELNFLKAQINPHALFNSLNTIYGHIDRKNQTARNILLQFSELLRYQLYDCNADEIILEKELTFIKNYVAFQQLRKESDLNVTMEINVPLVDLKIAPLLLVVLLENAFKFAGARTGSDKTISIHLQLEDKSLHVTIKNTLDSSNYFNQTSGVGGIGIINLKRRLELLYYNKYKFSSRKEEHEYIVDLIIDLS